MVEIYARLHSMTLTPITDFCGNDFATGLSPQHQSASDTQSPCAGDHRKAIIVRLKILLMSGSFPVLMTPSMLRTRPLRTMGAMAAFQNLDGPRINPTRNILERIYASPAPGNKAKTSPAITWQRLLSSTSSIRDLGLSATCARSKTMPFSPPSEKAAVATSRVNDFVEARKL